MLVFLPIAARRGSRRKSIPEDEFQLGWNRRRNDDSPRLHRVWNTSQSPVEKRKRLHTNERKTNATVWPHIQQEVEITSNQLWPFIFQAFSFMKTTVKWWLVTSVWWMIEKQPAQAPVHTGGTSQNIWPRLTRGHLQDLQTFRVNEPGSPPSGWILFKPAGLRPQMKKHRVPTCDFIQDSNPDFSLDCRPRGPDPLISRNRRREYEYEPFNTS